MVNEYYQPDAVFQRIHRLPPFFFEPYEGYLRPTRHQYIDDDSVARIREIYGSAPLFRTFGFGISDLFNRPNPTFEHPSIELDLKLFQKYYHNTAMELGEGQLRKCSEIISGLTRRYNISEERRDFREYVSPLLTNYRNLINIYSWLRSPSTGDRNFRQQGSESSRARLVHDIRAQTGIPIPSPPLRRPNSIYQRSGSPFSNRQSEDEIRRSIQREVGDYNANKELLFRRHPISIFILQNRESRHRLQNLMYESGITVEQKNGLLYDAIRDIQSATNAFQDALREKDYINLSPLLDLAKVSLFGSEENNAREFALTRMIDRNIVRLRSLSNWEGALLVLGVLATIATIGLAGPYVLLIEVALSTAGSIGAVQQYLQAERNNARRAQIEPLHHLELGIRIAAQQENLDPLLWMMLLAAGLSSAISIGSTAARAGIRAIIARRAAAEARTLIAAAGSRISPRGSPARPSPSSRAVQRLSPGSSSPSARGINREVQAVREAVGEGTGSIRVHDPRQGAGGRAIGTEERGLTPREPSRSNVRQLTPQERLSVSPEHRGLGNEAPASPHVDAPAASPRRGGAETEGARAAPRRLGTPRGRGERQIGGRSTARQARRRATRATERREAASTARDGPLLARSPEGQALELATNEQAARRVIELMRQLDSRPARRSVGAAAGPGWYEARAHAFVLLRNAGYMRRALREMETSLNWLHAYRVRNRIDISSQTLVIVRFVRSDGSIADVIGRSAAGLMPNLADVVRQRGMFPATPVLRAHAEWEALLYGMAREREWVPIALRASNNICGRECGPLLRDLNFSVQNSHGRPLVAVLRTDHWPDLGTRK